MLPLIGFYILGPFSFAAAFRNSASGCQMKPLCHILTIFAIIWGMDTWVPRYQTKSVAVPHNDLIVLLCKVTSGYICKMFFTLKFHYSTEPCPLPGAASLLKLLNLGCLGMLLSDSHTMIFKPFEAEAVALILRIVSTMDCGGGTYHWFWGWSGGSTILACSNFNCKICLTCLAVTILHLISSGLPNHKCKATNQYQTTITSTPCPKTRINVPLSNSWTFNGSVWYIQWSHPYLLLHFLTWQVI